MGYWAADRVRLIVGASWPRRATRMRRVSGRVDPRLGRVLSGRVLVLGVEGSVDGLGPGQVGKVGLYQVRPGNWCVGFRRVERGKAMGSWGPAGSAVMSHGGRVRVIGGEWG
jgi:hypothetical protein